MHWKFYELFTYLHWSIQIHQYYFQASLANQKITIKMSEFYKNTQKCKSLYSARSLTKNKRKKRRRHEKFQVWLVSFFIPRYLKVIRFKFISRTRSENKKTQSENMQSMNWTHEELKYNLNNSKTWRNYFLKLQKRRAAKKTVEKSNKQVTVPF